MRYVGYVRISSEEQCGNYSLAAQRVADFLSELHLPDEYQETTANAIGELLGQENLGERIEQIKGIIDRLDYRWDMGFIKEEEYVKRREELKVELAQLQPIPRDELVEAHKLLKDFKQRWSEGNDEERQRIMSLILERVWVQGDFMVALLIRPQYLIWVREGLSDRAGDKVEPAQLPPFLLEQQKENGNFHVMGSCRCGSDGRCIGLWHFGYMLYPAICRRRQVIGALDRQLFLELSHHANLQQLQSSQGSENSLARFILSPLLSASERSEQKVKEKATRLHYPIQDVYLF